MSSRYCRLAIANLQKPPLHDNFCSYDNISICFIKAMDKEKIQETKQNDTVYFPEKGCHLGTNRSDNET